MKSIPNWPGYFATDCGHIFSSKGKRILKAGLTKRRYCEVKLSHEGHAKTQLVHRLVCSAFHGFRNSSWTVNHKNLIKHDNRPENLEWLSEHDNKQHAVKMGAFKSGVNHYSSYLSQKDIDEIRASSETQAALAVKFGMNQSGISRIKNGKAYREAA